MASAPYTAGLHYLGRDVYAYLQPSGSWGLSNCGLVHDGHHALLFDTQFTLDRTQALIDAIRSVSPDLAVETVVNSHPNGDHAWGNQLFAAARIISSACTAQGMHEEISPAAMTAMRDQSDPDTPAGRYMRRYFGQFDFAGITLTPAGHTFSGRETVQVGTRKVNLIEVGPAHTDGDVIAFIPDRGIVFAGDILFTGDHPVMWSGPLQNWIKACETILDTGADIIVPGHGPITDAAGVRLFKAYLEHLAEHTIELYRLGVPYDEAAGRIPMHSFTTWGHPERLIVTTGTAYRHLGGPAPARNELIAKMMATAALS